MDRCGQPHQEVSFRLAVTQKIILISLDIAQLEAEQNIRTAKS